MKVYTKTGDDGSTSLVGGGRVSKSHPLIEACGKLDELGSFVALLSVHCSADVLPDSIQRCLLCMEACVASQGTRPFEADTTLLEERIDAMTAQFRPSVASFFLRDAALPPLPTCAGRCAEPPSGEFALPPRSGRVWPFASHTSTACRIISLFWHVI